MAKGLKHTLSMEQIFLCLIQFVKSEYYYGESEDAKEHEA
jgi:hypothetical protein